MTKRKTVLPARKQRDRSRDDDSLLLRSAESLGRVIGALQRELDKAARQLSADPAGDDDRGGPTARPQAPPKGTRRAKGKTAKTKVRAKTKRTARTAAMATRQKAARAAANGRRIRHG
jgi:hypothetical protein